MQSSETLADLRNCLNSLILAMEERFMSQYLLFLLLAATCLSGCATATRGTHEVVKINSEPSGARAISNIPNKTKNSNLDGFYGCEPTPCEINFSRRAEPVISIQKEGYKDIKVKIVSSVATSSNSVPRGTIVAGTQKGSHVVAGSPEFLKSIPIGGAIIFGGVMSFGAGSILDVATGAGLSLTPNPITAFLAPESSKTILTQQAKP